MKQEHFDRLTLLESRLYAAWLRCGVIAAVICLVTLLVLLTIYSPNRPRDYAEPQEHFYYGSIGSDISGGLPLKVMQVLPELCGHLLPANAHDKDYTAFGLIQEPGRPMPIGFSVRRQFIDFTALNCAGCHTGQVRAAPGASPRVIAGMPANKLNLLAFFQFLFECSADYRFNADAVLALMEKRDLLGPLDGLIYRLIVPRMRAGLLEQARKLKFLNAPGYTQFGPGRVSTFDTFKFDQFAYFYRAHNMPISPDEIFGIVDFPSIWNQAPREGLRLHWDGNNTSLRERNLSAALAAGAAPVDMDLKRLFRIENWLKKLPPPAYPFAIDRTLAVHGKQIYSEYCAVCHDFGGREMGKVVPLPEIGTDDHRVRSYTAFFRLAQIDFTRNVPWTFSHFSMTNGYANQPLDGIWARAPYLHNGSVPSLWDLLKPAAERPKIFTIGNDLYDPENVGFRHEVLSRDAIGTYRSASGAVYDGPAFVLDSAKRANGNQGHSGKAYGTELDSNDKRALIEYLKTK